MSFQAIIVRVAVYFCRIKIPPTWQLVVRSSVQQGSWEALRHSDSACNRREWQSAQVRREGELPGCSCWEGPDSSSSRKVFPPHTEISVKRTSWSWQRGNTALILHDNHFIFIFFQGDFFPQIPQIKMGKFPQNHPKKAKYPPKPKPLFCLEFLLLMLYIILTRGSLLILSHEKFNKAAAGQRKSVLGRNLNRLQVWVF